MAIRKKIKHFLTSLADNKSKTEFEEINIPPDIVTKANEGDAKAQLELGKIYFEATSIENNYTIAFKWIRHSAEQGNMEAQFRLGDFSALGFGTVKNLSDSYKWYTKAAIQGYKKALIRIHNLYQEDIKMYCRGQLNSEEEECTSDDFKKENNIRELYEYRLEQNKNILNGAVDYYTDQFKHYQSSDQKNPDVQLNLAFLYQYGYGTRKCSRWAFEYYTLAAEQGDIDAQYNLGHLYQQHTRKKFNYREAFQWYTKSAQGGNIAAQRCLAYFYLKGLATGIDYEVAVHLYTKAAEAGDSQSQVTLGLLYRKGHYVIQDLSMAVRWYTLSARQGSIVAQNCLAQLHQRGMLIDDEFNEDISEYFTGGLVSNRLCSKLSADTSKFNDSPEFKKLNKLVKHALIGDGPAMFEIGLKYYNGSGGFLEDKDTGIKWIKKAANREHSDAQFMMSDLYKEGVSVEQNHRKSYIWRKLIAKQKDADAQCKVGIMYNKGLGVRKDPLEASKWFTWAADQGNSDAQFYFGLLRLYGHGIRENKKEAAEWLYKSVLQSNIKACHKLGKLYYDGVYNTKVKNYTDTGLKLLKFAAKYENTDAQMDLGSIYKDGEHVQQNIPESVKYYTMAADSDDIKIQYDLAIMYLNGIEIYQDYIKAYSLFKKASNGGHKNASNLFQTPIVYDSNIRTYSNVLNMFIQITEKGVNDLSYNIGLIFDHRDDRIGNFRINYIESKKWHLRASKKGDSRADFCLGIMYEFGRGVKNSLSKATEHYENAAKKQNSDAMCRLAFIYLNKNSIFQNSLVVFHLFTKASSMGCTNATKALTILENDENFNSHMGILNEYSDMTIDRKKLISMLKKATKNGHAQLQYQLGVMYKRNNNMLKAFKWLSLAADIGVTDAYYRLGVMYENGRGVKQDYVMAARMYEKATERDHEDACYRLGRLYQYGSGVELDYSKSYRFYKKAAEMNQTKAEKVLNITQETKIGANGDKEENFFESISREYQDSLTMCKYVAEHGDPELQFKVGFAYENCFSDANYYGALKWYSMAVITSHREAINHLGLLYEKGLGVSQDYQKAIQLYNQAYQLGSEDALHRLGIIYHHGKGIEIDPEKAIEYYTLSAKFGKPEYQCELGRLYEEGELVKKNALEALKWYTKAFLQGCDDIGMKLHDMYEHIPYESFFFEKLFRNLSVASCNYFRLNDKYEHKYLEDINNQLGFMCYFGFGTDKNLMQSLQYFMKKYSDIPKTSITDFRFFEYDRFSFSQKINILKGFADDEECMDQFTADELYTLGMVFYDGKIQSQYFKFDDENIIYTPIDKQDVNDLNQHSLAKKDYSSAIKYLKRAADQKHHEALVQLGIMYYCADGVQKKYAEGDKLFSLVSQINIEWAKRIAVLYHTHNDIKNFPKAFEYYKNLEKTLYDDSTLSEDDRRGLNELIQTGLGLLYEYGDGIEQDYQKAIEYYTKLADDMYKIGYLRLGLMYYYGKGVPVDYRKTLDLVQESSYGYSNLDKIPYVYEEENGLQTSDHVDCSKRNRVYCTKTSKEITGEEFYYFGLMYKYGQYFSKEEDEAKACFKLALDYGCQRAANEIKRE